MRPWFTLTIIGILACSLLVFSFIVDFVLANREMFETPFNIMIRVPFTSWSHTWVEVQFMYILTVSILLGATIVALTTLIFDTRRALKVRHMRKELARLQKALQEAQSLLPTPPSSEKQEDEETIEDIAEQETASDDAALKKDQTPVTPQDIAHSFEDAVEQGDFLQAAQKRMEEDLEHHNGLRPEGDIRARVTGVSAETVAEHAQDEEVSESDAGQGDENDIEQSEPPSEDVPESSPQREESPSQEDMESDDAPEDSTESDPLKEVSTKDGADTSHSEKEIVEEAEVVEEQAEQTGETAEVTEETAGGAKKASSA